MTTAKPTQRRDLGARRFRRLAAGEARLVALWADGTEASLALSAARPEVELFRYAAVDALFPRSARRHAPAIRLERADRRTSVGLNGERRASTRGLGSTHGRWPLRHPLGSNAPAGGGDRSATPFSAPKASAASKTSRSGPCYAGIIEPGHFRFHASGETIVRLEEAARLCPQRRRAL